MPASPDDHAPGVAHAAEPEDVLAAAEQAHLAARRTAPAQRRRAPAPGTPPAPATRPVPASAPRAPARARRGAQLTVAATVAAGWAAVQGFVLVLLVMALVQLAEGRTGSLGALARLGLAGWLLGHGVPLHTPAGPLGLTPLALSALAAWRVARAGLQVTRAIRARHTGSVRSALTVAIAVAVAYALLGALAAVALDGPGIGVSAARAALNLGVFGVVASGAGALGATGAFTAVVRRTPRAVRDGIRTGMLAALVVLGTGAGLAGLALALAGDDAADTVAAYRTGVAGQAGITLLCLAYAPNAATWAAAYLVGPGFAVGLHTTVRTTDVSLGALPGVPLFTGLPHDPLGDAGLALLAVPLAAGMVAGGLLVRRRLRGARPGAPPGWGGLLGAAVLAGPVAGLVLGLACALSSGPLGGGRLSQVGPVAWQVGLAGAGVVVAGALLGTIATRAATRPS
jgi:hypothetical protein